MIVISDSCGICRAEVPTWHRLLARLMMRDTDKLILVAARGRTLADDLGVEAAKYGIRTFRVTPTNRVGFSQETGIGWTPETLALDAGNHIRVSSEVVTPTVFDELLAFFGSANR